MKALSNTKTELTVIKVKNTSLVLKNKHQLHKLIVDSRGRPDTLAINLYWDEFRSWHNPKKIYNKGNVVHSSRLKKKGISTSYKKLATKYNVSENTIRRKLVLLEELELISRDFETETKFKKVFHNQLIVYVWQQTPHFYNPMGVDREQIKELRLSTNHEYIESKYSKSSILANNDNKTPCNTSDNATCKGGKGTIVRDDRGYPHDVEIQNTSQTHLDKGIQANKGILKNENTNIKLQNSSQSQLNKSIQGKGGIIIREDRGIIVGEDTYILREELESLTESSLRSSSKEVSILIKSTVRAQETENTTCSNAILMEHSQVAIPEPKEKEAITICDQTDKPKLLTAPEKKPNIQEEISIMKLEEPNLMSDKETRKMLLSKAIFDAFGAGANEVQDNCAFEELAPDKVGIKPGIGVSFNDIEKAKIRRCIKAVYGEEVTILAAIPKPMVTLAKMDNESGLAKSDVGVSLRQNPQWLCLRSNLVKALQKWYEGKYAEHILKNWFDKLSVSPESSREKLILIGESYVIHRIDETYISAIEQAVLARNFEVELRYEGNRERPIILTKEIIKRAVK
jgi:hypothetical protein